MAVDLFVVCKYLHGQNFSQTLTELETCSVIQFKLCRLVHLAINKRAPTYIQDLLTTTASIPDRASNRSASNNDLVHQSTRLKLGERVFSVAEPCIWNRLPTQVNTSTNTAIFKRNLKMLLFQSAYSNTH